MAALYQERYKVGSKVRVADSAFLQDFMHSWRRHHPLRPELVTYAGVKTTVKSIGYYHGGDCLYELEGVPGTWHEQCLAAADGS